LLLLLLLLWMISCLHLFRVNSTLLLVMVVCAAAIAHGCGTIQELLH
jgi:hypothetical protein